MKNIRLLPVVVMAIAALLVLKTIGLVTNGGYVLTGVSVARAAGGGTGEAAGTDGDLVLPGEPTLEDTSPTLDDLSPTLGAPAAAGHGSPAPAAEGAVTATAPAGQADAYTADGAPSATFCGESDARIEQDGTVVINAASSAAAEGEGAATAAEPFPTASFAASMADCLPSGDAVPLQVDGKGGIIPLIPVTGGSQTEQQLLERLAARRTELQQYEQDLALRASIVDAAEQRIEERAATLAALEAQISSLVDQRQAMETGQFAGIVAMYETMKPKDAANIFNSLEMEVLLRVAKTMSPRKMAPILAAMDAGRAQELTVRMADLADRPATEMTPDDLAALPQIVGQ